MGIEIECKFFVIGDGWCIVVYVVILMVQGYINDVVVFDSGVQKVLVCVCIQGVQVFFNLKLCEIGYIWQEFDYLILVDDVCVLFVLCVGGLIDKCWYLVEYGGWVWEVDEFFGDNVGLVVVEIELECVDQFIVLLVWVGEEVIDDVCYYNLVLVVYFFSCWDRQLWVCGGVVVWVQCECEGFVGDDYV